MFYMITNKLILKINNLIIIKNKIICLIKEKLLNKKIKYNFLSNLNIIEKY